MKKLLLLSAFALLAGVIAPNPVAAQDDEYIDQVIAQLEAATETLREAGYEALVWEGSALEPSTAEEFTVTLAAGSTYVIVGVCDSDCSDLDISLLDGDGDLVVQDTETDDAPVIEFTVTRGGEFTLNVNMFECSAGICYYGLALLAETKK